MPYIIGTAGHIDHGKTSLIKALTGEDTDRLKEEKERGISIDLGFAHFDLPDGTQAGIVDVPGHERFIRNMLAGAHGIDLVLFTVAADDGVMPQTEEHLDIVHLLGVKLAIFLITKTDLAPASRIQEVDEEIKILTLETSLEGSPVIPFSAVTGQGLPELREQIVRTLQSANKPAPKGYFRLPVDRAFSLQGHGLVVTGTALSGEIKNGAHVRCLPGDQTFRIRSLQVHGHSVESARWGQRTALNLAGQEKDPVARGHVICDEKLTLATDRFDTRLEVRPAASKGIKNHQRVRIHLGTAERLGKLILLGRIEKVEPKQSAFCQITLTEPLLALRGDRFIVRDETARRTLGGGIVLHPWPKRHRQGEPDLEQKLNRLCDSQVPALIETFLEESDDFAIPLAPIYQFLNLKEEEAKDWIGRTPVVRSFSAEGEKLYATEKKWQGLKETISKTLQEFHASHPLAAGMDMEEARAKLPYEISPRLFRVLVDILSEEKAATRDGNLLSRPGYRIQLGAGEKTLTENIKKILGANPMAPPDLKQLEKDLGAEKNKLAEVIRVMEREKSLVRVAPDLYFLSDCVDKVRGVLYKYLAEHGEITAATFRDLLGSSRKYIIALLEYFDRDGTTVRVGDARRLRSSPPAGKQSAER
ncbi:MAG: selenocysteine-specific translation elongation factor [Deltaproteobacteria bacterium RIFCSPLOWO2_12_FULL_60_19]|nr:MAG: selenocysteine-specific translation elongation factor [Deltaproteobacteria bacterium RIFCSPLOWO2_12_FULL_60_19]